MVVTLVLKPIMLSSAVKLTSKCVSSIKFREHKRSVHGICHQRIKTIAAMSAESLQGQSCKSLGVCSKDTPLVSISDMPDLMKSIPRWKLATDQKSITLKFSTRNFMTALEFLNQAGAVAEEEGHHPDFHLTNYRDVEVALYTHAAGGLTMFDFIVAAKIDAVPVDVLPQKLSHD
ncbi:hypothetical protein CEUSTIGMA_g519.t1 [Chlamydomonas eustigma]|uniref:4a-hydroxytetrahydrobiopterin dehydratase n=1 Tax=Chlamydomonas eustigma TaxID=1157962 RepID=A0A250WQU4_9CHLO|nr:hypothetical protein CEUSTIGMA_g519.t1 [Chlamydomonas eustigma]|eukprot:GAX73066.1 hypothetical protein CEUSTIGMA_g519.t1 [Chlamydomonas eustigma]